MKLEHFAQMRALESAYASTNQGFVDHLLSRDEQGGGSLRQDLKLKRVQFDTLEVLYDDLERVCALLDCSKRQFLEGALWEAINKVQQAYQGTLERVAQDPSGVQFSLTAVEG